MTQTFEKNTRFGPGQKIFAGQHLLLALEVLNPSVPVRQTALANVAGPTKEADAHKVKSEENWKRLFANIFNIYCSNHPDHSNLFWHSAFCFI